MLFIPVSVHKSFQSSSSTASTVEVDVDEDVDIDVEDVEGIEGATDVDVDIEDVAGTTASPDWRSSTRTETFGRPPSIRRDKPFLRFSRSHN